MAHKTSIQTTSTTLLSTIGTRNNGEFTEHTYRILICTISVANKAIFHIIPPQAQDSILARLVPTTKNEICAVYVGRNRELNIRIDQIREITKHAPGDIIKYLDDTLEKIR